MKMCTKCGERKPFSGFHTRVSSPDGMHHRCKTCRREDTSARYAKNRERILATQREQKYGLAPGEYALRMAAQGGKCAVCGDQLSSAHVDHSHSTGVVRGLLCPGCNLGLGHFRDSPEALRNAALYLEAHG